MALPLFCHGLGDDLGLEGGIHPAKFGTPFIEGCRADAMLATELRDGRPGLSLFEDDDDLGIAKA